jgi:hypothetical protein
MVWFFFTLRNTHRVLNIFVAARSFVEIGYYWYLVDRWSSFTIELDWACTVMELHLLDCIIWCISCVGMVVVVFLIVNSVLAI